tara:strand:- start:16446 stop:17099 length:654 start_codon:yes stop_codon:yes gene_type:complete
MQNMNGFKVFAVLTLLLLSACTAVSNVPTDYQLSSSSGNGLLLASVTYKGRYSEHSMMFREVGSSKWNKLKIGAQHALLLPSMLDWDIESPGLRGNVFAVELPAGEYEFASWYVGSGVASTGPVNPFSIRFDISPGDATYAGNFHFIKESSVAVLFATFNVGLENEFDRDIALIKQKYGSLDIAQVYSNVAEAESLSRIGGGGATQVTIPMPVPMGY